MTEAHLEKEKNYNRYKMPFWSMVIFMVKWVITSILVLIILAILFMFISSIIIGTTSCTIIDGY
ncbi:MAG: hypothetical protein CL624_11665 [Arcobacter sp.]|nr:hypothetical protein [Arcobacter sp.]